MAKVWFFISILFVSSTQVHAIEATVDGIKTDVPVCGGFAGLKCNEKQWCDYPSGATCGVADRFGTCRPRPEICTKEFIPVCGCDGQTYSNACHAAAAGFDVAYAGTCRKE